MLQDMLESIYHILQCSVVAQVLPKLKEKISIERARMRLKAALPKSLPSEAAASLRDLLNSKEAKIESEDASGSQVGFIDIIYSTHKVRGRLSCLSSMDISGRGPVR